MNGYRQMVFALGLLSLSGAACALSPEDKLKAAFVYNFAKFITWPAPDFATQPAITVCVAGKGVMEQALAPLANRTAQGKNIVLRTGVKPEDLKGCEILFVSESEKSYPASIAALAAANSVLTVSDRDGFAQANGMIGLSADDSKIVFDVNLDEIEKAGLKVNAQLLRVARTVFVQKGKR